LTPDTIHTSSLNDRLTGISDWNTLRGDMAQNAALTHDDHRRRGKPRFDAKIALYCVVNTQNNAAARAAERAFP
jgi:hypothetical protein